jgi:hypothetical protein
LLVASGLLGFVGEDIGCASVEVSEARVDVGMLSTGQFDEPADDRLGLRLWHLRAGEMSEGGVDRAVQVMACGDGGQRIIEGRAVRVLSVRSVVLGSLRPDDGGEGDEQLGNLLLGDGGQELPETVPSPPENGQDRAVEG